MFTTERFFYRIWSLWLVTLVFLLFFYAVGPKWVIGITVIVSLWTFFKCIKCAYRSDSFTEWATLRLSFSLATSLALAVVLSMIIDFKQSHQPSALAGLMSLAFVVPSLVAFGVAYLAKCRQRVFSLVGDRVEVYEQEEVYSWKAAGLGAGLGAGLSSITYPLMVKHDDSMVLMLWAVSFIALYMVYYRRHAIASLRDLKRQERAEAKCYTFIDIEYIHELRNRSWLARLLAHKRVV